MKNIVKKMKFKHNKLMIIFQNSILLLIEIIQKIYHMII